MDPAKVGALNINKGISEVLAALLSNIEISDICNLHPLIPSVFSQVTIFRV
jgi:hypothetical protein